MAECIICPQCGSTVDKGHNFCSHCGFGVVPAEEMVIVKINPRTDGKTLSRNILDQIQMIGSKAQKVVNSEKASEIVGRAKEITDKASTSVSSDKTTKILSDLITLMVQVAHEVKNQIPPEMVKAIDLTGVAHFVAFSVGVSIDLEKLTTKKRD